MVLIDERALHYPVGGKGVMPAQLKRRSWLNGSDGPMDVVWRKSSRSNTQGGACVEVATLPDRVVVRDSKDPDGGLLVLAPESFTAFITAAKHGEFDLS